MSDAICLSAMKKMRQKYDKGMKEHGGMEKSDVGMRDWLLMLQEEHMDAVFYCEKLLSELDKIESNEDVQQ